MMVAIAWWLGVQFGWPPANWLAIAVGYLAWCVLVGLVYSLRPRAVGLLLGLLGGLTLVPGLLAGTIGIFGLMWITFDEASPSPQSRTLAPGLECVGTEWGGATTDDGHTIHIYRYLSWLPLLRREVRRAVVNETPPRPGHRCGDLR